MTTQHRIHAQEMCESFLKDEIEYNTERKILPSENRVAHRLLSRGVEMREVYEELQLKARHRGAIETFLRITLNIAAFSNLEELKGVRNARQDLNKTNQRIAKLSAKLASLLDHQEELHNTSGVTSDTHYSICDLVVEAAASNYLFSSYVQEELSKLHGQFDLKYWPSLSEVVNSLSENAKDAPIEPTNSLTGAGIPGRSSCPNSRISKDVRCCIYLASYSDEKQEA